MQTLSDNSSVDPVSADRRSGCGPSAPADARSVLAGASVGIGLVGAVLAIADIASPLRPPFTLFFLIAAPAAALAALLPRFDPLSRSVVAVAGAMAADLLIAQAMLSLHVWSARGGVAAIAVFSALLFLLAFLRRRRDRTARSRNL